MLNFAYKPYKLIFYLEREKSVKKTFLGHDLLQVISRDV